MKNDDEEYLNAMIDTIANEYGIVLNRIDNSSTDKLDCNKTAKPTDNIDDEYINAINDTIAYDVFNPSKQYIKR